MQLSWPFLLFALVVLWTPLIRLIPRSQRRELLQAESTHRIPLVSLLRVGWNWLDLFRSGVGAWVLVNLAILPPLDPKASQLPAMLVSAGLMGIGVAVQAFGNSRRFQRLIAPVFYLLGIAAVLLPWQGLVFGGLLAFVLADMTRGWIHLFWLMPACLAVMLRLFGGFGAPQILVCGLWALPVGFRLLCRGYTTLWVLGKLPGTSGVDEEADEATRRAVTERLRANANPAAGGGKLVSHGRSVRRSAGK